MPNSNSRENLSYARRVYDHTFDWYKNADAKAQIILTLDGLFIAFVTSSIFMNPGDLRDIVQQFERPTWIFLTLMSFTLTGSIICAVVCLWSRIPMRPGYKKDYLDINKIETGKAETYIPDVTWFFQKITWLDPEQYQGYLLTADHKTEVMALATNLHTLSKNVLRKHLLVNFGFLLAGVSLILFFAMGISYIVVVKSLIPAP